MESTVLPWERREDETPKAYAAFCVYRDLGPARRSIDAAYRASKAQVGENGGESGATGKRAPSHWEKWSSDFDWVKRAEAYDSHMELLRRKERETEHLNALEAHRSRSARMGALAQEVAITMLGIASDELRRVKNKAKAAGEDAPEGERKRRGKGVEIPRGLATFIRAGVHAGTLGSVAEAHALGVEELMQIAENQE